MERRLGFVVPDVDVRPLIENGLDALGGVLRVHVACAGGDQEGYSANGLVDIRTDSMLVQDRLQARVHQPLWAGCLSQVCSAGEQQFEGLFHSRVPRPIEQLGTGPPDVRPRRGEQLDGGRLVTGNRVVDDSGVIGISVIDERFDLPAIVPMAVPEEKRAPGCAVGDVLDEALQSLMMGAKIRILAGFGRPALGSLVRSDHIARPGSVDSKSYLEIAFNCRETFLGRCGEVG